MNSEYIRKGNESNGEVIIETSYEYQGEYPEGIAPERKSMTEGVVIA